MEQWLSGSDVELWCDDDCMPATTPSGDVTGKRMIEWATEGSQEAGHGHVLQDLRSVGCTDLLESTPDSVKLKEINGNELTNGNSTHMKNGISSLRKRKIGKLTEDEFVDENWVVDDQK